MYPLDVTYVVMRRWRHRLKKVRGHPHSGEWRLVRIPPIQACYRTPGALRV